MRDVSIPVGGALGNFLRESKEIVFLPKDFRDPRLGSREEVADALAELVAIDELADLTGGIYARKTVGKLTGRLGLEYPLSELAREYAVRVGATVVPTDEEFATGMGRSTQVAMGNVIGVDREIPQRLWYGEGIQRGYVAFEYVPDGRARIEALGMETFKPVVKLTRHVKPTDGAQPGRDHRDRRQVRTSAGR